MQNRVWGPVIVAGLAALLALPLCLGISILVFMSPARSILQYLSSLLVISTLMTHAIPWPTAAPKTLDANASDINVKTN
jgi:hypothetical protein